MQVQKITVRYWQVLSAMIHAIVHVSMKTCPTHNLSTLNVLGTETHNKHIDRVTYIKVSYVTVMTYGLISRY